MNYIGILTEYEQILIGNRKEFSQTYLPRVQNSNDLRKVLRYITEGILHWTPQQTISHTKGCRTIAHETSDQIDQISTGTGSGNRPVLRRLLHVSGSDLV